jgi:hypothetical protein
MSSVELNPIESGTRFGRWVVVSKVDHLIRKDGGRVIRYACICDCGTQKTVLKFNLTSGHSKGCSLCGTGGPRGRYSDSATKIKLRSVFTSMHARCEKPSDKSYRWYGARGIKVCERWKRFKEFYSDMRAGYAPGLSIDRIDNDQGYSPENCRWTTHDVQCRNRRRPQKKGLLATN